MSIFLGLVFLLAGLALAVFLGITLYRDPEKDVQAHGTVLKAEKDPEAA
jgi:hypothetical protein